MGNSGLTWYSSTRILATPLSCQKYSVQHFHMFTTHSPLINVNLIVKGEFRFVKLFFQN